MAEREFWLFYESDNSFLWQRSEIKTREPVLVSNLEKTPSYWIVPFVFEEFVIGFVRIFISGQIFSVGSFISNAEHLDRCTKIITGISRENAVQNLRKSARLSKKESS